MDRTRQKRLAIAVFALVAVLLVGIGAAPIFEVTQGAANPPQPPAPDSAPSGQGELDLPLSSVFIVVIGIVLVGLAGLVTQFARDPWDSFITLVEGIVASALIVGFWAGVGAYFQSRGSSAEGEGVRQPASRTLTPVSNDTGFGEGTSDPLAFPVDNTMFLALALGVVCVVAFLAWRSGVLSAVLESTGEPGSEAEDPEESLEAVGRVAGDAADEVESAVTAAAADNVIYDAWKEMVGLLGVSDPQSDTPRQFARAAVDAGMDDDDVSLLTRTFEEVRYGDETLSDQRREEVTEVFREIERSFGEDSGDSDDTADGELEETQ